MNHELVQQVWERAEGRCEGSVRTEVSFYLNENLRKWKVRYRPAW